MCRQHLLGEHGEIHKFRHSFVKKHNMIKRIELGQIDPYIMAERHNELVKEMSRRGYNHKSPYKQPDISYLPQLEINLMDSRKKCELCKKRVDKIF